MVRFNLFLLAASIALTSFSQLPQPTLTTVFPAGAQQGTTIEAVITGTEIDGVALIFSVKGITAVPDAKDAKKHQIIVASDVPPGLYDVRVVNKLGVSNPRRFAVGSLPEVLEGKEHKTRETAQEVTVPCIVNGRAESQGDDWFKLLLKKDQRIVLSCFSEQLDSKMVPAITLFDAEGRELKRARMGASISWSAPGDGPLFVRLNDSIYRGGAEHPYRLQIDAKTEPATTSTAFYPWPAFNGPTSTESTTNEPAHPQEVSLPCFVRGSFFPAHDVDAFRFKAKKGETWWIEVVSQRLGLPTNPRVVVQRVVNDKPIDVLELDDSPAFPGAPDFDASHLDPEGKFEAKEDGDYLLTILDQNNSKDDSQRHYTLAIRQAASDFALIACPVPAQPNKPGKDFNGAVINVCNHNLHRGEVLPIRLIVLRRDGFAEPIAVQATHLPAGVSCTPIVIGPDIEDTMLFLTAAEDAKSTIQAIQINGKAASLEHQARGTTNVWSMAVNEFIEPSRWRFTDEIMLGVVEEPVLPVTLTIDPKPFSAQADAKVKIAVQFQRRGDFKDALKLKPAGIPGLDKAKDLDIAAGATSGEYELDLGPLKLKPSLQKLWFTSSAKVKATIKGKPGDVTAPLFSTPVSLNITAPPKK